MASIPVILFPFAAVYVGDASASSTPLQLVTATRTKGAKIAELLPSTFENALGNAVQSGNHLMRVTLIFLGDDDMAIRLSRGLSVGASDINGPMSQTLYSLFLQSPQPGIKSSYYFPNMRTERVVELTYSKTEATALQVTFIGENRDVTVNLHYKKKDADLISIMGAKSPI